MKLVYKYLLVPVFSEDSATAEVNLPLESKIIHFGLDPASDVICLWAEVPAEANERATQKVRRFAIVPTGMPFDTEQWEHTATVRQGPFMWHIYKELK